MDYYKCDATSGLILYSTDAASYALQDDQTDYHTGDPVPFFEPKWDGSAFVENLTGTPLTDALDAYKIDGQFLILGSCNIKWNDIHGSVAIAIEHKNKLEEANTIQATGGKPESARTSNADTPYLDEELTQRIAEGESSLTLADIAAEVITKEFSDTQDTAKLGMFRKKALRAITAATGKTGVDTAVSQLDTDLLTIT